MSYVDPFSDERLPDPDCEQEVQDELRQEFQFDSMSDTQQGVLRSSNPLKEVVFDDDLPF